MPYIKKENRPLIDSLVNSFKGIMLIGFEIGDLNYIITKLVRLYEEQTGTNYKTLNEIIGVLECVKQEYYRRIVVPYEKKKCELNGDVF